MRGAGIRSFAAAVEPLDLMQPARLRPDEVLVQVVAAGVGPWDELVRRGEWDIGLSPPMAIGVEAAGVVQAVGDRVTGLSIGERVMTHSLALRGQGAWAEYFVVAAVHLAGVPADVSLEVAAVLPVPGLTADQVLRDALRLPDSRGASLLVNGGGGVTGTVLVQMAVQLGAEVFVTAGADSAARLSAVATVVDRRSLDWPQQVRRLTGGHGVDLAVNAVPRGAARTLSAVRDGGTLATITADRPPTERAVEVVSVVVVPDGPRLAGLGELVSAGAIEMLIGERFCLELAAQALSHAVGGTGGRAIVLQL